MSEEDFLAEERDLSYCGEADWGESTLRHYEDEQAYYIFKDGKLTEEIPKNGVDEWRDRRTRERG